MIPTTSTIKAEFLNEEGWPKRSPIPRGRVLEWMKSEDLEVLGATHTLLHKKKQLSRVEPPLEFAEFFEFMTRYYERCLRESNDQGEEWEGWQEADSGFNLNHSIVFWFIELRRDKSTPRQVLVDFKVWLASVLLSTGGSGRHLATAVFDHLLLNKRMGKFFSDWQDRPELRFVFFDLKE